jgi:hypothetical protein
VLVIIGALIITKRAADDAHVALVASNRAWVGSVNAIMGPAPAAPNANIIVNMAFRNTGREPALKTSVRLESYNITVTTPIDEIWSMEQKYAETCLRSASPRDQTFVIFPSTSGTNDYNASLIVNRDKIDWDVIYGTKYLLIQACVIYETFGKLRHSAFCYFAQAGKFGPGPLPFCDKGNEAD